MCIIGVLQSLRGSTTLYLISFKGSFVVTLLTLDCSLFSGSVYESMQAQNRNDPIYTNMTNNNVNANGIQDFLFTCFKENLDF